MTTRPRSLLRLTLTLSVGLLLSGPVEGRAQSFEVVHAFAPLPREPSGKLLQLADGYFLGTSRRGGIFDQGTIYILYRQSETTWHTFVIHSFSGPEGKDPVAGIMRASDGNFYGTARSGGASDGGTVFRMTPAGRVSVLYSFAGLDDGVAPEEPLVEAPDGSLWSTAIWGGRARLGSIFRITKAGAFTTVHAFNRINGEYPNALVMGPDGLFYGSTQFGGDLHQGGSGNGTIFRIARTGALTTLHAFEHEFWTSDLTFGTDGNLYGTSSRGAVSPLPPPGNYFGLAFRATVTGIVTALHYFVPEDGFVEPIGGLVEGPDGAFYGGTSFGFVNGNQDYRGAAMFRLAAGGQVHKVADLGGALGREPSGLMLASDGRLYGTTRKGGVPLLRADDGFGSALAIGPADPATLVFPFSHPTPLKPTGRLAEGPEGALFGTSCGGGTYGRGTVYRMSSGGLVTTLHSFTGPDGECPLGGLTLGPNGVFYGTTVGSLFGAPWGSVFSITPAGGFTTLWSAATQSTPGSGTPGAFPFSAPTVGPDGQLYVTASSIFSGTLSLGDAGTVLRIASDGTVTAIAVFDPGGGYGVWPLGPLTLGSDGSFYGTTSAGSGNGVYRMTPDGALNSVSTLNAEPATLFPRAGLVQGRDGRLYGSGMYEGAGAGFLFAATTSGAVSVLHEFSGIDGLFPYGELLEHAPGRFLGVTVGSSNVYDRQFGTVFEVTANGAFSTLHRFSWLDGASPVAGVLRTSTGDLYGTTAGGGLGGGVIFRFVAPAALSR